jgi:preprotein translocase subunit SecF
MSSTVTPSQTRSTLRPSAGLIDVIKHRWIYIGISLAFLVPGLIFIVLSCLNYPNHAPIRMGIDFTGGTLLQYTAEKPLSQSQVPEIRQLFEKQGYPGAVVQIETPANQPDTLSIRVAELKSDSDARLKQLLSERLGAVKLVQKNAVGPTLAGELFVNGLLALVLAYALIVGYLSFRFQFDFALCAIVALLHDTLFVFGTFSMLGYLFHTEIDSLFITGILTVIGFSVHDTIVVFDRLRENSKLLHSKKLSFGEIANISVNQTLRRSINTSMTALLTLFALYILGGSTTRDFVLTMLLGILVGTYSSIFVASALLAWWREKRA